MSELHRIGLGIMLFLIVVILVYEFCPVFSFHWWAYLVVAFIAYCCLVSGKNND